MQRNGKNITMRVMTLETRIKTKALFIIKMNLLKIYLNKLHSFITKFFYYLVAFSAVIAFSFIFFAEFFSWKNVHVSLSQSLLLELQKCSVLKYSRLKIDESSELKSNYRENFKIRMDNLSYCKLYVVVKFYAGLDTNIDATDE